MYYAAINSHSTDTSAGFANTWSAVGFPSRKERDAYVIKATDLATKAIKATELASVGAKHGRISYYTADGVLMQYCSLNDGVAQFISLPDAEECMAQYWDSVATIANPVAATIAVTASPSAAIAQQAAEEEPMRGTEKQIAYAEKVRAKAVRSWVKAENGLREAIDGGVDEAMADIAADILAEVSDTAKELSVSRDAAFILDKNISGGQFGHVVYRYKDRIHAAIGKKDGDEMISNISYAMWANS